MGNGYELAAITYIKGILLPVITSQGEGRKCGAEKKELFSAKFTILLVISGLKMSAQYAFVHFLTLCMRVSVFVYVRDHLP